MFYRENILTKGRPFWAKIVYMLSWIASSVWVGENFSSSLYATGAPLPVEEKVKHYSVEDFFSDPLKSDYQISPDGKYIAYLSPWQKRKNVLIYQLGSQNPPKQVTYDKDRGILFYRWKGNDYIVAGTDQGGDENFYFFSIHIESKKIVPLTPRLKVRAEILDDLRLYPEELLIQHNQRDPRFFDVYRINVRTGESQRIAENPGTIVRWLADHKGEVRAAVSENGLQRNLLYRRKVSEPFQSLNQFSFKDKLEPLSFAPDNQKLYLTSNLERDKAAIFLLDPVTHEQEMIYAHPEADIENIKISAKTKQLLSVEYITWKRFEKFFDPEYEQIHHMLQDKLPNYALYLTSHDDEEKKWIVVAKNDRNPGKIYFFDGRKNDLQILTEINPKLEEKELALMQPIHYKARDGLTLHGYLTLPLKAQKLPTMPKLPLIVFPHGGPRHRDQWEYDRVVQFFANRGYAVLQVNYRGSSGYGRKFWQTAFKQWGRDMQNDLTDGVHWAIQEGIADPARVGIYGLSFGGYMALCGAAFTPDLYAAAASSVGISNIFTLLQKVPPYWEHMREAAYEWIGHPEKDKELLEGASPLFHADKIKIPLLIAHGANDPLVNKGESDQIVEKLKERGSPVEYIVEGDEGHGFFKQETRQAFYEHLEKFFGRYLSP